MNEKSVKKRNQKRIFFLNYCISHDFYVTFCTIEKYTVVGNKRRKIHEHANLAVQIELDTEYSAYYTKSFTKFAIIKKQKRAKKRKQLSLMTVFEKI
jgi:hypothetical protein